MPLGRAAQLGNDQAVAIRSGTVLVHLAIIEHGDVKG
jgi:hypothetical protein